jgi:hypothetical protein
MLLYQPFNWSFFPGYMSGATLTAEQADIVVHKYLAGHVVRQITGEIKTRDTGKYIVPMLL